MSAAARQEPGYKLPYVKGCEDCALHQAREDEAHREGNRPLETDWRVRGRRHLRVTHKINSVVSL